MGTTRRLTMESCARLALGLLSALTGQVTVAEDFLLEAIADGVFLHQGKTVPFGHPEQDDVANLSFVIGKRCVAVVDTGGSLRVGRALREAIRRVTPLPVCYVINTHVHPDHMLGNAVFLADRPRFVGHTRLPAAVEYNRTFFLSNYGEALSTPDGPAALVPPDLVVEDSVELDLGGRTLQLRAHPPAHTDHDLSIYDPATGTLWLGFLFVERVPALDGSILGWIKVTESIASTPAERVVPGNGPAPASWPDAAANQLRYLRTLVQEIRDLIAQGGFLEDALARVGQSERARWLLFDQHHGSNVTRAYAELEWE